MYKSVQVVKVLKFVGNEYSKAIDETYNSPMCCLFEWPVQYFDRELKVRLLKSLKPF